MKKRKENIINKLFSKIFKRFFIHHLHMHGKTPIKLHLNTQLSKII